MLSLTLALLLHQSSPPVEMRLMRHPAVYGDQICFSYADDLWVCSLEGGIARRLTSDPGNEMRPHYSPDGSMITFTGEYGGNQDVYVMPSEGGEPRRLTFEPNQNLAAAWRPDGKVAYTSAYGNTEPDNRRLWLVDPKGGLPIRTPISEASDLSFSPDGSRVVYNRFNSDNFNWRRYRGGSQGFISIYDLKNNTYEELPHGNENSWNPMWVGDSIYFASDKNESTVNLYRYDLGSRKQTQLTHYTDADIHWPSTDGKTIVYEKDGYLFKYDIASGQAAKVTPRVLGDLLYTRPALRNLSTQITEMSLSPSGARIAVEARGHIFTIPAKHGETRDISPPPSCRYRYPMWSPDGKTIAFIGDQTGDYQVYTMPQMGGEPTQVSDHHGSSIKAARMSPDGKHIFFITWDDQLFALDPATKQESLVFKDMHTNTPSYEPSPDGKWLAYLDTGDNNFQSLWMYEVATGKKTQITDGFYNDENLAFDLSGRYLYIESARTFNPVRSTFESIFHLGPSRGLYMLILSKDEPNPLRPAPDEEGGKPKDPPPAKVDLDGLGDRIVQLPVPVADFGGELMDADHGVFYEVDHNLFKFDLKTRESQIILANAGLLAANWKGDKLAYYHGGTLGIVDPHPGVGASEGKVDTSDVEAEIDPRAEWKQIFWDSWRFERDVYYDSNMRGLNWKAIGDQYSKYLPYVAHRDDLNYVIGLMIGELGTSHTYVGGGDAGQRPRPVPIGQLGADYEIDNGKVRFKKVYKGESFDSANRGPLGEPGVNVSDGDYLLAINGQQIDAGANPDSLLIDKVGKAVVLTVNSQPSSEGARDVTVYPIGSEADLRYATYVESNRKKVAQMSNGRIAYMHVPDTANSGLSEFLKSFYGQAGKDALIVDERWNHGGYYPSFYTEMLSRSLDSIARHRESAGLDDPNQVIEGPKVMLINGYAGSGGDAFPYLFRRAGLGPLIGKRTWGGLVGYGETAPLVDGGFLSAPGYGWWDPANGKWIAENHGVDPDIDIDSRPDLIAQGKDPQLDKAVEYLLAQLAKEKPKKKQPDFVPARGGG